MKDSLSIAHCFARLHRNSMAYIVDSCRAWNLTYSEFVLLLRLFETEGRSQEELALELDSDKAAITRSIQLLEQKNFIYRKTDEDDRRKKLLYVTEYGRSQQAVLQEILERWVGYLAEGLSVEEFEVVFRVFTKLAMHSGMADFEKVRKGIHQGEENHE